MPNGFISDEEVKNELAQKKLFVQGFDKKGRPLGVVFGAKHYSAKRNLEEFRRMHFTCSLNFQSKGEDQN